MLTLLSHLITTYRIGYAVGFFFHMLWSFFPACVMIGLLYILYRTSKSGSLSRIK
ncbi:MAG TPA: hypothetical protein VIU13_06950 [Chryseolinea sp.]